MMREHLIQDRRRTARVKARGRVVIHGDPGGGGELLDVSATGVRFGLADEASAFRPDDRVALELRFDGTRGGWWRVSGRIVRLALGQAVVAFDDVPPAFVVWIQEELEADLEARSEVQILLVDAVARRRGELAVALRAMGHRVDEAATPLDAIDRLGESLFHPRMIAIADTVPLGVADELRAYVRGARPDLRMMRMMAVAR